MIFDDTSALSAMDGANMEGVEVPTQTSFDPSLVLCPALESVCVPPIDEILAQTTLECFTDSYSSHQLYTGTWAIDPLGVALVESFMIPDPWLSARSPISTISHPSLATSPLEQISPWTTPGPLQASSPVAPIESHYMFCPPPDVYHNGPEVAPCWPPGQVDEIMATSLPLPSSLPFSLYFDGQQQAWMNGEPPTLEPSHMMTLGETSTALTTFHPTPVPLSAKDTMVGGKQSRQRLTKAGRITK